MKEQIEFKGDVSDLINGMQEVQDKSDDLNESFKEFDKEKSKAFKAPNNKISPILQKVVKGTKEAAKESKTLSKITKDVSKSFLEEVKSAKSLDDVISISTKHTKSFVSKIIKLPKGLSSGTKAAKIFGRALIAIPIFAIIAAITALVAVFTKSQAGAEKLQRVFAGLTAIWDVVIDRAVKLGNALLNFKTTGLDGVKESLKGIGEEMLNNYNLGVLLEGQFQNIEKAQILDEVRAAKTRAEYERLKTLAEDRNKPLEKRIGYLKQAAKIDKENLDNQLKTTEALIKTQLGIVGNKDEASKYAFVLATIGEKYKDINDKAFIANLITSQIGISEAQLSDFETLAERVKSIYDLQADASGREASLVAQIGGFIEENAAKQREAAQKAKEAIKQKMALEESLYKLIKSKTDEVREHDKDEREKYIKNLKDNLQSSFDQLKQLAVELDISLDISQSDIDKVKAKIEADFGSIQIVPKIESPEAQPVKALPIDLTDVESGLGKFFKDYQEGLGKAIDEANSKEPVNLFKSLGIDGEGEKLLKDAFKSIKDSLMQFSDLYIEQQQRIIDASTDRISDLEEKVSIEQDLHDNNINNNLASTQKQLEEEKAIRAEAIADQIKMQKLQFAVDTATQASGLITASVNIFKSLSKIPFVGIPLAITTIGLMLGAFGAMKAKAYSLIKARKGLAMKLTDRSHDEGGEHLVRKDGVSTGIEAERDEGIIVTNKEATRNNWGAIQRFASLVNSGRKVFVSTENSTKHLNTTKIININSILSKNSIDLSETNTLLRIQNKILSSKPKKNRNKIA